MFKAGLDEKPLLYFSYYRGLTSIGLQFERRDVELYYSSTISYDEAVDKYLEIAKSFGIELDRNFVVEMDMEDKKRRLFSK